MRAAQCLSGVPDSTAGGDDILDECDRLAGDVCAFGQPAGAVRLGGLADEQCWYSGQLAEDGGEWDPAKFQATEQVGVGGDERNHGLAHASE